MAQGNQLQQLGPGQVQVSPAVMPNPQQNATPTPPVSGFTPPNQGPQPLQQTPGGLFGNIGQTQYTPATAEPTAPTGLLNMASSNQPVQSQVGINNPNATAHQSNFGPVDTGVDQFRQFGDRQFDFAMDRLRPDIEQRNEALAQSLLNRGLQPGTEAYASEMSRMDNRNNDLMSAVALGAEQQGLAAQNQYFNQESQNNQFGLAQNNQNYGHQFGYDQLRNQRDIASMNSAASRAAAGAGAQASMRNAELAHALGIARLNEDGRQFDIGNITQTQGMDHQYSLGLMNAMNSFMNTGLNQFNAQQNANNMWYNQAGQMANNAPGVIFNPNNSYVGDQIGANSNHMNAIGADNQMMANMAGGLMTMFSDRRLKKDIRLVDQVDGVNVYEFRYIDQKLGDGLYRGVMAQEVMETHPDAVHLLGDHYAVDYSKLPVDMEAVNEEVVV